MVGPREEEDVSGDVALLVKTTQEVRVLYSVSSQNIGFIQTGNSQILRWRIKLISAASQAYQDQGKNARARES
jgi:hypothetical protein